MSETRVQVQSPPIAPPIALTGASRVLLGATGVVGFALATALAARLPGIPAPPLDVPITLQTLVVGLCGLTMGARLGMLSMALYLLVGLLGIPVFSEGGAGAGHMFGVTGGYLVGFLAAQPVIARLGRAALQSEGRWRRHAWAFGAVVAGHAVIFAFGVVWGKLARDLSPGLAPVSWPAAWAGMCLVFLPGMLLKSAIASVPGPALVRLARRMGW